MFLAGVATLCAWVLVPIYLIALGGIGGEAVVNAWPKLVWPNTWSLVALQQFLHISGVWLSVLYSIEAATLCMVVSIVLGAPAGYALARYRFRGATAFRLFVLLTRAFPVAILALPLAVSFIRLGLYDSPIGVGLMHSVLAMPFAVLVTASLFQAIPRELEEAAWVFGCSGPTAFLRVVLPLALPGITAAAIFAFVISWNEVFAAIGADRAAQDADGLPAVGAVGKPAAHAVRRRVPADRAVRAVHLPGAQAIVQHVGDRESLMADIVIEQVGMRFGGTVALESVSLTVADGELVALLGPSGCGKTTLLRIIAGLETQTSGRVLIGGRDMTGLPPRRRGLAMVFQNYAVFPHMTVRDNVAFGLRMTGADAARIERQVARATALLHIEPYLHRYPAQLSGGQRQRVAVARALAVEPAVLLMDEPLSNLDALLRLEMRAELKTVLQAAGTTTLYVTHDQTEAMGLADRIAVLNAGRIVQVAPPAEIYRHPASRFVGSFLGTPPMNFLPLPVESRTSRARAPAPSRPAWSRVRRTWHPTRGSRHRHRG